MTWVVFLLLGGACLLPLGWSLWRPARPRGRREADLALFRAQRAELDDQLAEGRLEPDTHALALLEVQRRILSAPEERSAAPEGRGGALLTAALLLIPAAALGLYLWKGTPGLPDAPFEARMAAAARDEALLAQLRERVLAMDPASPQTRQGWLLLGSAERSRGRLDQAVASWRVALEQRFEPGLAADVAELEMERGEDEAAATLLARALAALPRDPRLRFMAGALEARAGRVESARSAWRALLAEAPPDAPWRAAVEQQLRALP